MQFCSKITEKSRNSIENMEKVRKLKKMMKYTRLYILLQRYNFESNTQRISTKFKFSFVVFHCKDTILKWILNRAVGSKQLKLLLGCGFLFFLCATENLHHIKLLVGNAKYSHVTTWWENCFHSTYVCISVRPALTVSQIDWELKHSEAITE